MGNKLSNYKVVRVKMLAAKPDRDVERLIVHPPNGNGKDESGKVWANQLGYVDNRANLSPAFLY